MQGKIHRLLVLALPMLAGCATVPQRSDYVGRPIADAVKALGPPVKVADYPNAGRFFVWSLSDLMLTDESAGNPANWLDPMTRINAPNSLDEARLASLPDSILNPPFRPGSCTLSLIANWDERAKAWVVIRAIGKGAPAGGHCGLRQ